MSGCAHVFVLLSIVIVTLPTRASKVHHLCGLILKERFAFQLTDILRVFAASLICPFDYRNSLELAVCWQRSWRRRLISAYFISFHFRIPSSHSCFASFMKLGIQRDKLEIIVSAGNWWETRLHTDSVDNRCNRMFETKPMLYPMYLFRIECTKQHRRTAHEVLPLIYSLFICLCMVLCYNGE